MIKREVLEDIQGYEAKLFGPLTLRKAIWICLGAVPAIIVYFTLKNLQFYTFFSLFIAMLVFAPIASFGVVKVYGFPITKFIGQFFRLMILSPKYRLYAQSNPLEQKLQEIEKQATKSKDAIKQNKRQEKAINKARKALLKGRDTTFHPLP